MGALVLTLALAACGGGSSSDSGDAGGSSPLAAPTVTTQPASQTVADGMSTTFAVVASGSGLSYQWQRNGSDIAGATNASYTFTAADADTGATYRVVVTNTAGNVMSNAATLTVSAAPVAAPTIATAPQPQSVQDGGSATFAVVAKGEGPFSYRWQKNGSDIAGATAASYATGTLTLADSGATYVVIVTNGGGSITSGSATLTVVARPPAITTAPAAQSANAGTTATFSVVAAGSAPLSYQWQRNGSNIAGATSASYSTPVLATSDSGAAYRVIVTNAGGSATSAAATLSVTAVVVAPSVATAPHGVTVTAGQTATFTVTADGTAPLSYQWQLNGSDISGATSQSYTTAVTKLADSGAKYSVRVSNSAGAVTSATASLTVNALTSVLSGRAWTAGQQLETGDSQVYGADYGIDDAGNVTVVFLKSNGSRTVLYATRGTPGAAGTAPTWSTPTAIDVDATGTVLNNMGTSGYSTNIAVAPNGNAVESWYRTAPCTASTYLVIGPIGHGTCNYLMVARYLAASGTWEAPIQVADNPTVKNLVLKINSAGDVVLSGAGWVRSTSDSTGYTSVGAVWWLPHGTTSFKSRVLSDVTLGTWDIGLDAAGNMLLAGEASQNSTTDLVAYRGTQAGGFGAQIPLESHGNAATFQALAVGTGGQQLVLWSQNNGTATTLYAAAAASATANFDLNDIGTDGVITNDISPITNLGSGGATISDSGVAHIYKLGSSSRNRRLIWSNGTWASAWEAMPGFASDSVSFNRALNRNGDMLVLMYGLSSGGNWYSYDGASNVAIQSQNGQYVLGTTGSNKSIGLSQSPVLSTSGIGAALLINQYDTLPSAAVPSGDRRSGIYNLWGTFLK